MPAAADILSALPDPLLGLILSKIPIREAVRCSVLSKRWRFLHTQIPQLTLSPILLLPNINPDPDSLSVARVEKIIFNLLLLRSPDIEAFHLFKKITNNDYLQSTRESLWQWVRYATSKNVQHQTLCDSPDIYCDPDPLVREIPPAHFSCTRLTTLRLSHYKLTDLPSHFSGFNHLIACSFKDMQFTDNSLSSFISHSPFLQTLTLRSYAGIRKLVISAPKLTHFSIHRGKLEVLTLNSLKLRNLEMESSMIHDLRINGVLFRELSYLVSRIKMQCGSNVTELWLDLSYADVLRFSVERVVEIVGDFKTLKKLDINDRWGRLNQMGVLVDNLLERLPRLARLWVSGMFDLELVRDPILPCVTSLLGNLRKVKVRIHEFDKGEITILDKLLESACALEIMELELPYLSEGQSAVRTASSVKKEANAFLTKLLYQSRSLPLEQDVMPRENDVNIWLTVIKIN